MPGESSSSGRTPRPLRATDNAASKNALSSLLYQSSAVVAPTRTEIDKLLSHARARNRALGITGMLLHENGRFVQWLEGPKKSMTKLWRSIRGDPRHGEIEVLCQGSTPSRMFGDFDMQLLQRHGSLAGALATSLTHGRPGKSPTSEQAVSDLATLAIAGRQDRIDAMLAEQQGEIFGGFESLCGTLFEPAVHRLGDWWDEDRCSDSDVTQALCSLQIGLRHLRVGSIRVVDPGLKEVRLTDSGRVANVDRSILVATQPAEPHMIGSVMVGDCFHRAGWNVQVEFPQTDAQLLGIVKGCWFDLLSLALSDVYGRADRMGAMAATIRAVRSASRNPQLLVMVGGRIFKDDPVAMAVSVGADIAYPSANEALDAAGVLLAMGRGYSSGAASAAAHAAKSCGKPLQQAALPEGWAWVPRDNEDNN